MPNHVTNVLTINADNRDEIIKSLAGNDRLFDFNTIIKKPESLEITSGTFSEYGEWLAGGNSPRFTSKSKKEVEEMLGDRLDEYIEIGKARINNRKIYGFEDWYGWAPANWGTKWNAYDNAMRGDSIKFETAWSMPEPIFIALSAKFPEAEFIVNYADEDTGNNCGIVKFKAGCKEIVSINTGPQPDGYKNWTHFAFLVCYPDGDKKEHCYNDDWEYDESLDC